MKGTRCKANLDVRCNGGCNTNQIAKNSLPFWVYRIAKHFVYPSGFPVLNTRFPAPKRQNSKTFSGVLILPPPLKIKAILDSPEGPKLP